MGPKPPSLMWDDDSNIGKAATEANEIMTDQVLSPETARMLAGALEKVEAYNSTQSLATARTPSRLSSGTNRHLSAHPSLPDFYSPIKKGRGQSSQRARTASASMMLQSLTRPSSTVASIRQEVAGAPDRATMTSAPLMMQEEEESARGPHIAHDASPCEEIWIQNYASDAKRYTSISVWADTALAEAQALVQSQTLPANALAAMSAQLLVDMEQKFSQVHGEAIHDVVDEVLGSVFILKDDEGNPTSLAAEKILERNSLVPFGQAIIEDNTGEYVYAINGSALGESTKRGSNNNNNNNNNNNVSNNNDNNNRRHCSGDVLKHSIFGEGLSASKKKLALFMEVPTYFDQMRYLWSNLKKEIVVRPPCFRKMQAMRAERQMEARALERACDHWAKG